MNHLAEKKESYLNRYLNGLEPGISREEIRKRRRVLNWEMKDAGCPESWRKSAVREFTQAAKEAHFAADVDWDSIDEAMAEFAEEKGLNSSDEELREKEIEYGIDAEAKAELEKTLNEILSDEVELEDVASQKNNLQKDYDLGDIRLHYGEATLQMDMEHMPAYYGTYGELADDLHGRTV